ncbi:unnamed protein product [Nezara viridula]|uniref:Uncharacterized protein n=1 Tax=Nezara viridula TaxID=85310 RepID=A0A9P0E3E6_NEZVI|nr:unnamed protein product [Nezara viridula]
MNHVGKVGSGKNYRLHIFRFFFSTPFHARLEIEERILTHL